MLSRIAVNNLIKSNLRANNVLRQSKYYLGTVKSKRVSNFDNLVVRDQETLVNPKFLEYSYAVSNTTNLHLLCDTIGERIDTLAQAKPNDISYKFALTQTTFTFRELKQRVDELAQSFLNMGLQKGDRLAIMLPNIPEMNLSVLAAASIGVIAVLMNPAYQLVEIEYMLKKTGAKGIIMLDNLKMLQHYAILNKICPELETSTKGELNSKNLPDLKHVILVKNRLMNDANMKYSGTWSFNELEKFNSAAKPKPYVDFDDAFAMLFTVSQFFIQV